jgi:hypothetical protein
VIKRKMSNWKLKRAGHHTTTRSHPATTIAIVAATKPGPTSRKKRPA